VPRNPSGEKDLWNSTDDCDRFYPDHSPPTIPHVSAGPPQAGEEEKKTESMFGWRMPASAVVLLLLVGLMDRFNISDFWNVLHSILEACEAIKPQILTMIGPAYEWVVLVMCLIAATLYGPFFRFTKYLRKKVGALIDSFVALSLLAVSVVLVLIAKTVYPYATTVPRAFLGLAYLYIIMKMMVKTIETFQLAAYEWRREDVILGERVEVSMSTTLRTLELETPARIGKTQETAVPVSVESAKPLTIPEAVTVPEVAIPRAALYKAPEGTMPKGLVEILDISSGAQTPLGFGVMLRLDGVLHLITAWHVMQKPKVRVRVPHRKESRSWDVDTKEIEYVLYSPLAGRTARGLDVVMFEVPERMASPCAFSSATFAPITYHQSVRLYGYKVDEPEMAVYSIGAVDYPAAHGPKFKHYANAWQGWSGTPIWQGNKFVGIHQAGSASDKDRFNIGLSLTAILGVLRNTKPEHNTSSTVGYSESYSDSAGDFDSYELHYRGRHQHLNHSDDGWYGELFIPRQDWDDSSDGEEEDPRWDWEGVNTEAADSLDFCKATFKTLRGKTRAPKLRQSDSESEPLTSKKWSPLTSLDHLPMSGHVRLLNLAQNVEKPNPTNVSKMTPSLKGKISGYGRREGKEKRNIH
jgi:hypothetical protein